MDSDLLVLIAAIISEKSGSLLEIFLGIFS